MEVSGIHGVVVVVVVVVIVVVVVVVVAVVEVLLLLLQLFSCLSWHLFLVGTAPWKALSEGRTMSRTEIPVSPQAGSSLPVCQWSAAVADTYLAGCCSDLCANFPTLAAAQSSCDGDPDCGGVTVESTGECMLCTWRQCRVVAVSSFERMAEWQRSRA